MNITGHELTAASSAVAALAILGGYLGVASANRNALRIAREERASRRLVEFESLKRLTYSKFLSVLAGLALASVEQEEVTASPQIRGETRISAIRKQKDSRAAADKIFAELELLAPDLLRELAGDSLELACVCTRKNRTIFTQSETRLRIAMRHDVRGSEIPRLGDLERMALSATSVPSPDRKNQSPASLRSGTGVEGSGVSSTSP